MTDHRPKVLSDYVAVVQRRWRIVVIVAFVALAASLVVSRYQAARYSATAQVLLNQEGSVGGGGATASDVQAREAATDAQLAHTPKVAAITLRTAGLARIGIEAFLSSSTAAADPSSNVLTLSVEARRPATAIALVNAYASSFVSYSGELTKSSFTAALANASDRIASVQSELSRHPHSTVIQDELATLVAAREQIQQSMSLATGSALIARPAQAATQTSPRTVRNVLVALVLGLVGGVGAAFLRDAFDSRVRSSQEVGEYMGLPLLARIPTPPRALRRRGAIAMLADPAGSSADPYRQLRVAFDFANADGEVRVVLIASPLEQSGKTTTVANLAVAFARAGRRVIAIDADLRRPTLGDAFGLGDRPGLTDVVLGHASLEDVLAPVLVGPMPEDTAPVSGLPGDNGHTTSPAAPSLLHVITGGTRVGDPSTVIESDALAAVLAAAKSHADVVLLDSAPLLVASDTQSVAGMVDGVILLLRASAVDRGAMAEATRLLGMLPATKLGFVLSGAEEERPYGYGAYGAAPTPAPARQQDTR